MESRYRVSFFSFDTWQCYQWGQLLPNLLKVRNVVCVCFHLSIEIQYNQMESFCYKIPVNGFGCFSIQTNRYLWKVVETFEVRLDLWWLYVRYVLIFLSYTESAKFYEVTWSTTIMAKFLISSIRETELRMTFTSPATRSKISTFMSWPVRKLTPIWNNCDESKGPGINCFSRFYFSTPFDVGLNCADQLFQWMET